MGTSGVKRALEIEMITSLFTESHKMGKFWDSVNTANQLA